MSTLGMVISRAAAVVPLTLLALAVDFMVVMAMIRPTPKRRAMVDRLAPAIKDVVGVIAGGPGPTDRS